jgi:hypothetical protein
VDLAKSAGYLPGESRMMLILSRFQANSGHSKEGVASVAKAKMLAESSGATAELARSELETAEEPCQSATIEPCIAILDRARILATALNDAYLGIRIDELKLMSDYLSEPASSASFKQIVESWKLLPGASFDSARSEGLYLSTVLAENDFETVLKQTDKISVHSAFDTYAACDQGFFRAEALAGLGRTNEAIDITTKVLSASENLGLKKRFVNMLVRFRTLLLTSVGRGVEALESLPVKVDDPMLLDLRNQTLLNLGRMNEARQGIDMLTTPFVFDSLDSESKRQQHIAQTYLALATNDITILTVAQKEWLSPDIDDPVLMAAVLTALGREGEAQAHLNKQSPEAWLAHVELAQRQGRWADARSLLNKNKSKVTYLTKLETALRRAYCEVALGVRGACPELKALQKARESNYFALFPGEIKRMNAQTKGLCPR